MERLKTNFAHNRETQGETISKVSPQVQDTRKIINSVKETFNQIQQKKKKKKERISIVIIRDSNVCTFYSITHLFYSSSGIQGFRPL